MPPQVLVGCRLCGACPPLSTFAGSVLHKLGVGGGYEIPNVPENKTRCVSGLERIRIRENVGNMILAATRCLNQSL